MQKIIAYFQDRKIIILLNFYSQLVNGVVKWKIADYRLSLFICIYPKIVFLEAYIK